MDRETRSKIYLEWVEEAKRIDPKRQAGEFTIDDFMRDSGLGRESAMNVLEEKVRSRKATKRKTSKGTFYSIV